MTYIVMMMTILYINIMHLLFWSESHEVVSYVYEYD